MALSESAKARRRMVMEFPACKVMDALFQTAAEELVRRRLSEETERFLEGSELRMEEAAVEVAFGLECTLPVSVTGRFAYREYTFCRRASAAVRYDTLKTSSLEELRPTVLSLFDPAATELAERLFEGISPEDPARVIRSGEVFELRCPLAERFQEETGRRIAEVVRDAAARVEREEKQAFLDTANARIGKLAGPEPPAYYHRGRAVNIRLIAAPSEDYHMDSVCRTQIVYARHAVVRRVELRGSSLFPALETMDASALERFAAEEVRLCLEKAQADLSRGLLLWEISFPPELAREDTPMGRVAQLFQEGSLRMGHWTVEVEPQTFLFSNDRQSILLSPDRPPKKKGPLLRFTLGDPQPDLPSLPGLVERLARMAGLWEEMIRPWELQPELHFTLRPGGLYLETVRSLTNLLSDRVNLLSMDREQEKAFLQKILDGFLDPWRRKLVLEGLNKVQLEILRDLYGLNCADDLTRKNARECYGGNPSLTDRAIEGYPEYLSRLTIPVDGVQRPLVLSRKVTGPLGTWTVYRPNPHITWNMIREASFRPLDARDFPDMTPAARKAWFQERARRSLREGDSEDRWAVLEILEKQMPKTEAVRFVKSDTGQTFLRQLTGQDREYARLFLEDLPGCKRLVQSLLPEGENPQGE